MDLKTTNNISAPNILKVAFIVSIISHLLFIFTSPLYMQKLWRSTELKAYKVELIRDVIADISPEKLEELEKKNSLKKIKETNKDSEETISLDTKDKRYVTYTRLIKVRLSKNWGYPRKAKELLMEGKSSALFTLSRDGQLLAASVTDSSGYKILDQEGIDTIIRAAPFPPFPETITGDRKNFTVNFEYRLTAVKK